MCLPAVTRNGDSWGDFVMDDFIMERLKHRGANETEILENARLRQ